MRRSAGAIFRERRPATIIRSDCRGLPRNTSAPNRAMSYRPQLIAIISMAQQARPKVTGQIDERRAHCTTCVTVVVRTGISGSSASRPICSIQIAEFRLQIERQISSLITDCRRDSLSNLQSEIRNLQYLSFLFLAPVERAFAPDVHV